MASLLASIREREPGESVLAAFATFVRQPRGMLAEHDAVTRERLAAPTEMITRSPAFWRANSRSSPATPTPWQR